MKLFAYDRNTNERVYVRDAVSSKKYLYPVKDSEGNLIMVDVTKTERKSDNAVFF